MPLLHRLPLALIYSRPLLGAVALGLAAARWPHYGAWATALLVAGVLTDVFDGVVARRLGIATERLRRLDSAADQIFWALLVAATWVAFPGFMFENRLKLLAVLGAEGVIYAVSWLRFGKEVATHSYGAKLWVLVSLLTLGQINYSEGHAGWLFAGWFWLALASRLEIVAILLLLRSWAVDVPTMLHAYRRRQAVE